MTFIQPHVRSRMSQSRASVESITLCHGFQAIAYRSRGGVVFRCCDFARTRRSRMSATERIQDETRRDGIFIFSLRFKQGQLQISFTDAFTHSTVRCHCHCHCLRTSHCCQQKRRCRSPFPSARQSTALCLPRLIAAGRRELPEITEHQNIAVTEERKCTLASQRRNKWCVLAHRDKPEHELLLGHHRFVYDDAADPYELVSAILVTVQLRRPIPIACEGVKGTSSGIGARDARDGQDGP